MNTSLKITAVIGVVFSIGTGYGLMEMAHERGYSEGRAQGYQKGYEQGHTDGQASMVQTQEQVLLQCTQWWFGEANPRAMQAINQYCDRRIK